MQHISFLGLFIVSVVAFVTPFLLGLTPARRLPSLSVALVVGIVIGPSGLDWVQVDLPIGILSMLGLAFLLFLTGLELDLERLRGRLMLPVGGGFLLSCCLALLVGYGFYGTGQVKSPLLIAIMLLATSFIGLVSLLKDNGEIMTDFGQLIVANATIAQLSSIMLLSLFFSGMSTNIGAMVVLLGSFLLLVMVLVVILLRLRHSMQVTSILLRLQDTTAQIRVRGAFMLLVGFVALASIFGLEVIFATFIAGVIVRLIDPDMRTHEHFRLKLEAIGFGVFIPIFFITSGLNFDLHALLASPAALLRVPIFLGALLLVRAVPAFFYRPLIGNRRMVAAGLLQASSLSFLIVAAQIGVELGLITRANSAALVAAGLFSVLIFPVLALLVMGRSEVKQVAEASVT
jgi:Kef-type K+ transport system membrane component KefB